MRIVAHESHGIRIHAEVLLIDIQGTKHRGRRTDDAAEKLHDRARAAGVVLPDRVAGGRRAEGVVEREAESREASMRGLAKGSMAPAFSHSVRGFLRVAAVGHFGFGIGIAMLLVLGSSLVVETLDCALVGLVEKTLDCGLRVCFGVGGVILLPGQTLFD